LQEKNLVHRLPQVFLALALLALLLYALVLVAIWWKQEKLLFAPTVLAQDHTFKVDSDVQEKFIEVQGAKLNALHLRLPNPKAIVLFLHGNGGSLDNWFVNTDFYRSMNVDLMMIDYRGYGKSSGSITSEQQLHGDVANAFEFIKTEYPDLPIVLIGRSLGTGLAAQLYASLPLPVRPRLMILVSPFSSLKELAAKHFAFVPYVLLRYQMRSDLALESLDGKDTGPGKPRAEVLLLHGDQDRLIPIEHSQRLAALQPRFKFKVIQGGAHNDLQDFPSYLEAIRQAISGVIP
jgi:uncharacterized protein